MCKLFLCVLTGFPVVLCGMQSSTSASSLSAQSLSQSVSSVAQADGIDRLLELTTLSQKNVAQMRTILQQNINRVKWNTSKKALFEAAHPQLDVISIALVTMSNELEYMKKDFASPDIIALFSLRGVCGEASLHADEAATDQEAEFNLGS